MPADVVGSVRELYVSPNHEGASATFEITVAICIANSAKTIAETVLSLVEQENAPSFELLMVFNGSTDASLERSIAAGQSLALRAIECESLGYDANARNAATREAAAGKIIFIDSDDLASPAYVARMCAALDRAPLVTGVWSLERLNADVFPDVTDIIPITAEAWPMRDSGWPYAPTGTLGFRKEVVEAVGGFRVDLGVACNNEWCFRAYAKGFDIVPVLDAIQHYRMRQTAREMFWQRYNYGKYEVAARKAAIHHGLPSKQLLSALGLGSMFRLMKGAVRARSRWDWYKVAGMLGSIAGHAVGSAKHRFLDI